MALLDSILGMRMNGQNPFEEFRRMQANPFSRALPGSEYLPNGGQPPGPAPLGSAGLPKGESVIPTDFAGTPPGLPNLPEDMQGFGFGQSAPKMNVNKGLRQDLIQQLLQQLMGGMDGLPGMGGDSLGDAGGMPGMPMMPGLPMMGGMGGMPGMGGDSEGGFDLMSLLNPMQMMQGGGF